MDTEIIKVGNLVPMVDGEGNHLQGKVEQITDKFVKMDFNHPLAGKDLHFVGTVGTIREATSDEISHGHVHGPGGHTIIDGRSIQHPIFKFRDIVNDFGLPSPDFHLASFHKIPVFQSSNGFSPIENILKES